MEQKIIEQLIDFTRNHYFGKYRGIVVDNKDRSKRGRICVMVPKVLKKLKVWAWPCVPYAGKGVGFYCLPDPGTGVWIEFEGGDPSFPIWTGCYWREGELPDKLDPDVKFLKTKKFTLQIDDKADEVYLKNFNESKLTVNSNVTIESGGATHTVGSAGVTSEKGATKVEVKDASFNVNKNALVVTK